MKFTFIMEEPESIYTEGTKVTHEFETDTWPEALEQFQQFLKGSGFHFDGNFELVDDEEPEEDPRKFSVGPRR